MGTSQLFGPEAGRLLRSLSEAGVRPDEINAMALSHAHPDHCWGTMRDDGTPTFPNATIYMAEKELAFWERCTDEDMKAVVEGVQKHLIPLQPHSFRCPMRFRRVRALMITTENSAHARAPKRWLGSPILDCG
jgi:metal-dependent hydrolase (beta-lactamase superfamily II)